MDSADTTRINRLEAIEAVKQLMGKYCHFVDVGYDLEGLGTLLVDDFVWDSNIAPVLNSRAEFLEFQSGNPEDIKWAFHLVNPMFVDVNANGTTAKGVWHLLGLHTMVDPDLRSRQESVFYTGTYDTEFVKQNDGWRIKRMKIIIHQLSPLTRGWVEVPFFWSRTD
jgi:hypothetical protein